MNPMMTE